MRYLKLFESFEDIDEICRKYRIENYTINSDGSIDVDYIVYLGILKETLKFYQDDNYKLISYCLMSNHVHLLLKTGTKEPSFFMRRINSMYARYFNSKYQCIGHLFQGRYFSNLINAEYKDNQGAE